MVCCLFSFDIAPVSVVVMLVSVTVTVVVVCKKSPKLPDPRTYTPVLPAGVVLVLPGTGESDAAPGGNFGLPEVVNGVLGNIGKTLDVVVEAVQEVREEG